MALRSTSLFHGNGGGGTVELTKNDAHPRAALRNGRAHRLARGHHARPVGFGRVHRRQHAYGQYQPSTGRRSRRSASKIIWPRIAAADTRCRRMLKLLGYLTPAYPPSRLSLRRSRSRRSSSLFRARGLRSSCSFPSSRAWAWRSRSPQIGCASVRFTTTCFVCRRRTAAALAVRGSSARLPGGVIVRCPERHLEALQTTG